MNLTEATSVTINSKEVKKIQLDGQIVYELINIQLTTNKQHIITGETVNINLTSNVINKEVELFKVIGLTKTKIETLRTDENGQASYIYTGTGAGNVSFVAVYDNKESNTVQIDDYVPAVTTIELATDKSAIISGQSVLLTATVKDQHGELITSGTVTFKENGVSIGTGSISSGVATLTASNLSIGIHSITAEVGSTVSNAATVNVLNVALSLGITGGSFSSYNNSPFTYTGDVLVDWDDGTIEEYGGGQLTHSYSIMDNRTVKIYGEITGIGQNGFRNSNSIQTVSISSGVTNLGDNCFRDCDITSIILSNSVESIGKNCFAECPNLTSITIPTSVINIGGYCFYDCTDLTEIVLNWSSSSDDIVPYVSSWIDNATSFDHFLIPEGTTALYEAKNYPSALLVEQTPFDGIDLESDKDIISYNGGTNPESATLTAQLTNSGSPVSVSGKTVTFEVRKASDDSLVETLTADTDSSGIATVSYLGKGTNSLYIQANSDDIISSTITIDDVLKCIHNARVGGVGRFVSDYTIPMDNLIEFRLKSIPNHVTIGFGNASTNDLVIEKNGGTMNLIRNVNVNRSNVQGYSYFNPMVTQSDFSFFCKKFIYQTGHVGMGIYSIGSDGKLVYRDYWECGKTGNCLVVQTYDTDASFEVDILIYNYSI